MAVGRKGSGRPPGEGRGQPVPAWRQVSLVGLAAFLALVVVAVMAGWLWSQARKAPHVTARVPVVPVAPAPPAAAPTAPAPVVPPGETAGEAPPWRRFAQPVPAAAGRPMIAIVIDDLGPDRKRSLRAIHLPAPVTLSWLPYARDLPELTRAARAAGHELLVHIPMQPLGGADPGPGALTVGLDVQEVHQRLTLALASFEGYVGVNNHMGSRFTSDRAALAPVLAELKARGLLWIDSKTTPATVGPALAEELRMPFAGRDVFLDNVETAGAVREQLARTEATARRQGFAIAIGHPHDATLDALAAWLPEMKRRGLVAVPVSAVVNIRFTGG